ncbi:MAG: hypothetical protein DMG58_25555, partial [Acidobacteria bacterium]
SMFTGISLSEFARVENVHAAADGDGIEVDFSSIAINNIAEGSGNNGIAVGTNSVLRANVAANNRGGGFYVYCPSSVIGNSASGNVANFVLITTGGNCTVSENSAP